MPKYTNMLVYFALSDTKVWPWGSNPTPGPNANGFASQWNIGLRILCEAENQEEYYGKKN